MKLLRVLLREIDMKRIRELRKMFPGRSDTEIMQAAIKLLVKEGNREIGD